MKVVRQISANWSKFQVSILRRFGIHVELGNYTFVIDENDTYFNIEPYLLEWDVLNTRGFIYSKLDIATSKYCVIRGWYEFGYPMPDDDNGYLKYTYNDSMCAVCHSGLEQVNPFRVKSVPKRAVWGLNWIYDEFFVSKDIYDKVFLPLGIASRNILNYKTGAIIESFVQLVIPRTSESLDLQKYGSEVCQVCGAIKYGAKDNGFFPLHEHPLPHIYKTKEFFGYGGNCYRKILISAELRDTLLRLKLFKMHQFIPCKVLTDHY